MNINPQIEKLLSEHLIPRDEALSYLLGVYFNLKNAMKLYPTEVMNKVNYLKIFEINAFTDKIQWIIPLFSDWDTKDDFIEQYRNLFKAVDVTKAGDRPTIIKKMKRFMEEYPQYTKEQILEATRAYIDDYLMNNTSLQFLQNAKYFIKKERNPAGSKLLEWLEIMKEQKDRFSDDY